MLGRFGSICSQIHHLGREFAGTTVFGDHRVKMVWVNGEAICWTRDGRRNYSSCLVFWIKILRYEKGMKKVEMKIVGKFGWRVKVGRDMEIAIPKCVVVVVLNPRRGKRETTRSGKNQEFGNFV